MGTARVPVLRTSLACRLAFVNKLNVAPFAPTVSLLFVEPGLKSSPALPISRRWTPVARPREALAAQFSNAVNSNKGKDAESGRILGPALRVHAG
jgi:hypothetical protein